MGEATGQRPSDWTVCWSDAAAIARQVREWKKFARAGCWERSSCLLRHVAQGRVAVTRQQSRLGMLCFSARACLNSMLLGQAAAFVTLGKALWLSVSRCRGNSKTDDAPPTTQVAVSARCSCADRTL
eukprot:666533-Pleurochrysis_carterae.AAC.2